MLPPEFADEIPMDLLGLITGLPAETAQIPWDGPRVRIIEHQAHAPGHAALVIEERGVLVAGDMLSDILMPFLDLEAADPIEDYLAALRLLEGVADDVDVVIPGHGSVGGAEQLRARIEQDRAYVQALRDGGVPDDPRVGPSATLARIGCPTCTNGNGSSSPRRESRTGRAIRDPPAPGQTRAECLDHVLADVGSGVPSSREAGTTRERRDRPGGAARTG